MNIGFVGVGLMGQPMCQRLLQAGHALTVWNRSVEKTAGLQQMGALVASSLADLAAKSDVIFLCLFDAEAVEQVVFGEQGLHSYTGLDTKIIVDHSSISPQKTQEFAARLAKNWQWLDAPVSGGTAGAHQGSLAIMVGGNTTSLDSIKPILRAYAAQITHMGPVGAGQVTKLCNQTIVTATIAAVGEAVRLAEDAGVNTSLLPQALAGGWADSVLLQTFVPRMLHLPLEATATVQVMLKDLNTIASLAQEQGTSMPVSHATQQLHQLAQRQGLGDKDVSYIIQTLQGKS